jgi:hypothetical protein
VSLFQATPRSKQGAQRVQWRASCAASPPSSLPSGCAAASDSWAQQAPKVWRIGYLAGSPRVPQIDSFLQGLKDLGYIDGQNCVIG